MSDDCYWTATQPAEAGEPLTLELVEAAIAKVLEPFALRGASGTRDDPFFLFVHADTAEATGLRNGELVLLPAPPLDLARRWARIVVTPAAPRYAQVCPPREASSP